MKFAHRLLADTPLIESNALSALLSTSPLGVQAAEHPLFKKIKESLKPVMEVRKDGIAVIPVEGALAYKPDAFEMLMGVEDSRNVLAMINGAAANDSVGGILLDIDSPGGMVIGGFEVADAVRAAEKRKPVVAWSGGWAASLAYLIASQATQIVASRTAQVGSIGAVISIADFTKSLEAQGVKIEQFTNKEGTLKGLGAPGVSLTEAQREHIQARVDSVFLEFKRQVLAKRPNVGADSMRGQVFYASDAKPLGLVDRIGSYNFALQVLTRLVASQ